MNKLFLPCASHDSWKPWNFEDTLNIWASLLSHMGGRRDWGCLNCKRNSIKIAFRVGMKIMMIAMNHDGGNTCFHEKPLNGLEIIEAKRSMFSASFLNFFCTFGAPRAPQSLRPPIWWNTVIHASLKKLFFTRFRLYRRRSRNIWIFSKSIKQIHLE